ncbi:MAG: 4'-phosphopantetheinyl transferase superfamily protein [Syntrophales bacterium]
MATKVRLTLTIPVSPYLKDHCFFGNIILPAAESLQQLASSTQSYRPEASVRSMRCASFVRFLQIPKDIRTIDAYHELEIFNDGHLSSKLMTTGLIKGTTVTRTKVHTMVEFTDLIKRNARLPMDMAAALDGVCLEIHNKKLYSELITFGPAYQNIKGSLFISDNGAIGDVQAAEHPALSSPLGSPFPFDGALHAACAWGARFHNILTFPVAFKERHIVKPTVPGELYRFIIRPVSSLGNALQFDIWIYDAEGDLREEIIGMMMKDVSGGRAKSPEWIQVEGENPLSVMMEHCKAMAVIDKRTLSEFAAKALSLSERRRFERMGKTRQRRYLAARLSLKRLSRKLADRDTLTPAEDIQTLMADGVHPACPVPVEKGPIFCSVSHDSRFAIAVADDEAIGVDVEEISERIIKIRRYFMEDKEIALTEDSPLGILNASIRIWSIKEGVTKATDRPLAESWQHVHVDAVGRNKSYLTVKGTQYVAFHDSVDDHVFTLVKKK